MVKREVRKERIRCPDKGIQANVLSSHTGLLLSALGYKMAPDLIWKVLYDKRHDELDENMANFFSKTITQ